MLTQISSSPSRVFLCWGEFGRIQDNPREVNLPGGGPETPDLGSRSRSRSRSRIRSRSRSRNRSRNRNRKGKGKRSRSRSRSRSRRY